MSNDHFAISVGDPGKQVANGWVNLCMIFLLGFRDGLRLAIRYRRGRRYGELRQGSSGFLDYSFPDMMSHAMDLACKVRRLSVSCGILQGSGQYNWRVEAAACSHLRKR